MNINGFIVLLQHMLLLYVLQYLHLFLLFHFFWFVCLGLYGNRGILPAKNVLEKGLLFITAIC